MDYDALDRVLALLRREKRLAYRVLRRRLQLDDETLEDLKDDLIYVKHLAMNEDAKVLVWVGEPVWTKATFLRGSGLCLLVGTIRNR
jgi:hypothetical protein